MSEWGYVIAAYGLTWVVLAGYAAYLRVRSRRARETFADAGTEVQP